MKKVILTALLSSPAADASKKVSIDDMFAHLKKNTCWMEIDAQLGPKRAKWLEVIGAQKWIPVPVPEDGCIKDTKKRGDWKPVDLKKDDSVSIPDLIESQEQNKLLVVNGVYHRPSCCYMSMYHAPIWRYSTGGKKHVIGTMMTDFNFVDKEIPSTIQKMAKKKGWHLTEYEREMACHKIRQYWWPLFYPNRVYQPTREALGHYINSYCDDEKESESVQNMILELVSKTEDSDDNGKDPQLQNSDLVWENIMVTLNRLDELIPEDDQGRLRGIQIRKFLWPLFHGDEPYEATLYEMQVYLKCVGMPCLKVLSSPGDDKCIVESVDGKGEEVLYYTIVGPVFDPETEEKLEKSGTLKEERRKFTIRRFDGAREIVSTVDANQVLGNCAFTISTMACEKKSISTIMGRDVSDLTMETVKQIMSTIREKTKNDSDLAKFNYVLDQINRAENFWREFFDVSEFQWMKDKIDASVDSAVKPVEIKTDSVEFPDLPPLTPRPSSTTAQLSLSNSSFQFPEIVEENDKRLNLFNSSRSSNLTSSTISTAYSASSDNTFSSRSLIRTMTTLTNVLEDGLWGKLTHALEEQITRDATEVVRLHETLRRQSTLSSGCSLKKVWDSTYDMGEKVRKAAHCARRRLMHHYQRPVPLARHHRRLPVLERLLAEIQECKRRR